MRNHQKKIWVFAILLIAGFYLFLPSLLAQAPHKEEITVIAPYEPTLPDVFKISLQPKIETEESDLPMPDISITPVKMNVKHNVETVQEAPPTAEQPNIIYRNHIRAGLGNYITPYLEFNAGSLRNSDYSLNLQFRHLSSYGKIKDYGYSAFSDNILRVSAKKFFDQFTLGAEARYNHDVLHHYGFIKADFPDSVFNTSKDELRQRFNHAGFALSVQSNNKEREGFHYDASFGYNLINDLFKTTAHRFEFNTHLKAAYQLFSSNDKQSIGLKVEMGSYRNTDSVKTWNNTLMQFQPYLRFKYQEYEIKAGLGLAFDHDTAMHFKIFPLAEGRLQLVENRLAVFVGIDGKIKSNSYQSFVSENSFVQSLQDYRNSVHKLRFYGGIQGSVGKHFDMTASISNTIIGDMPLFINDTIAPFNRFSVIYDDLNLVHGKLSATLSLSQQLRITTGFDIFHYSPDNETKAWHSPSFKTYFEGWYNYSEKIAFRGSVNANGKSWAKVWNVNLKNYEELMLKSWINISLGATYRHSNQLHFFLDARNISAGRHFYWHNYPGQRLTIMAGAGFSF